MKRLLFILLSIPFGVWLSFSYISPYGGIITLSELLLQLSGRTWGLLTRNQSERVAGLDAANRTGVGVSGSGRDAHVSILLYSKRLRFF